jgi:hypothetical protein
MGALARIAPQFQTVSAQPRDPAIAAERTRAGRQDRHEVRLGGAGDEETGCGLRKREPVAHPPRHLALNQMADMIAPAAIEVERGHKELGQHARRRARALGPAHETGVAITARIGRDPIKIVLIDPRKGLGRAERLGKALAQLRRGRAPDSRRRQVRKRAGDIADSLKRGLAKGVDIGVRQNFLSHGRASRIT